MNLNKHHRNNLFTKLLLLLLVLYIPCTLAANGWGYGQGTGSDQNMNTDLDYTINGSFTYETIGQPTLATSSSDGKTYTLYTLQINPAPSWQYRTNDSWWTCGTTSAGQKVTYSAGFTVLREGVSVYTGTSGQGGLYNSGFIDAAWDTTSYFSLAFRVNGVTVPVETDSYARQGTIYVSDGGPSGMYQLPGGKSVYAYRTGATPLVALTIRIFSSIPVCTASNSAPLLPPTTPEVPPVSCEFYVDGDIDLGVLDTNSASGYSANTSLISVCNSGALVKADIIQSTGGGNLLQMGGLNISVVFDNDSETITYPIDNTVKTHTIWGKVMSVGTMIPGNYSQSMIINLTYQ